MNERIKELHHKVVSESENMRWNIEDSVQLAKLIVRECIHIAYRNNNSGEGSVIADNIKKHFRVE